MRHIHAYIYACPLSPFSLSLSLLVYDDAVTPQYNAGTLPKPKDKRVKIRSVDAHRMVAVQFRGRSPDEVNTREKHRSCSWKPFDLTLTATAVLRNPLVVLYI